MSQVPPQPPTTPFAGQQAMMRPHRGAIILVLGIVGLVVCQPVGIAAWVMGSSDLRAMQAGQMDPSGEGLTKAGKICGMIAVALIALSAIFLALALALGVLGAAAGVGGAGGLG